MLNTKYLKNDVNASVVVFLVALPLCLGIALASGAPLFAGIIAGIVGGIVVGFVSKSNLGVSGPAAGLAVVVLNAITELQVYEIFLLAVVISGIFQILFSIIGAGKLAYFLPTSVIKGMLTAIGILIILKQIPHAIGFDKDFEGDESFFQNDGQNTFSELINAYLNFTTGPLLIGIISLIILLAWESNFLKKTFLSKIPGALIAVIVSIFCNFLFKNTNLEIAQEHLVSLPILDNISSIGSLLSFPKWEAITNPNVWKIGLIIAIIGSIETLLSVEATDKIDPEKNFTPTNRELLAQGIGNMTSGLIGGIPITQVIVRSTANVFSGGKTKISAILHGVILLLSVLTIAKYLNMIPLSALAVILIMVGYKLAKPALFKQMYKEGQDQFVPFVVTVIGIVLTDLLMGIGIGLAVGLMYVLYTNFRSSISTAHNGDHRMIKFNKDVFFYNKAKLVEILAEIKDGETVFIDASKASFIDHDIYLTLKDFKDSAQKRNITTEYKSITRKKLNYRKSNAIVSETLTGQ
ncbi:SulP family inorganic anion transporter [Lacihabitans sp. LS3-19]|uniref:SulP family inorganic anion transporter n=1 Tax=Lacihabitans sp. LS3-19 TaxID=2487335 RepID=UPI0020CF35DB|nr:SulP family inorganic anion transporter [Lacihabitans sp. LS3-19]MCP9767889.1 SulP family inorganic anion transporter [Lacihabitans sp. LS3-19]